MSSSVFFKFKSSKDPSRITFDGNAISVFELKREIITTSGLGDGTDFDLSVYDEVTNEEYKEDTTMIPRSTTVIARRIPAARPGYGKAARYVSGKAPVTAKNAYRVESNGHKGVGSSGADGDANQGLSEEARLGQLLDDAWSEQRVNMRKMADSKTAPRTKRFVPAGEPPATYVCHRCHQKGHWIQACPTNDDPNFSARPKIRPTTGIPLSQLTTIDIKALPEEDGLTDTSKAFANVMRTATGEYVIARSDLASWERFQAKANASTSKQQTEEETGTKEIQELGLQCPLCRQLFVDPVKTPCCGTSYCWSCIEAALVKNDLVCPQCSEGSVLIDDLVPDQETVDKIKNYQNEKQSAQTPSTQPVVSATAPSGSPKQSPVVATASGDDKTKTDTTDSLSTELPKSTVQTPLSQTGTVSNQGTGKEVEISKPANTTSSPPESKKRPAEEELSNTRAPPGPTKKAAGSATGSGVGPGSLQPPTGPAAMSKDRHGPASFNPPKGPASQQMGNQFNAGFFPAGMANNMGMNGPMNPMMMMMMMNPGMQWNGMMNGMGMMNSNNYPMGSHEQMFSGGMEEQQFGHQQGQYSNGGGPGGGVRPNWNGQWNGNVGGNGGMGMNIGGPVYNGMGGNGPYPMNPQQQMHNPNGSGAYNHNPRGPYNRFQQHGGHRGPAHLQQQQQQQHQPLNNLHSQPFPGKPNGPSNFQSHSQSQHSQHQQYQQRPHQQQQLQQQQPAAVTGNNPSNGQPIAEQGQNEEDSPYFRTPVNPSRANRRRLRRTDFTELQ